MTVLFYLLHIIFNLVPIENVATIEANAVVSEGVSRVRNALINGDYQSYDWDTGRLMFLLKWVICVLFSFSS